MVSINNMDIFLVILRKMGNILGRLRNSERNGEGDLVLIKVEEKKY